MEGEWGERGRARSLVIVIEILIGITLRIKHRSLCAAERENIYKIKGLRRKTRNIVFPN